MDKISAPLAGRATRVRGFESISRELQVEFFRKGIHLFIAVVPLLARFDVAAAMAILAGGTLVYAYAEHLRIQGREIALISAITSAASRPRDMGKFVLGPVTLGLGAMIALLLYPEPAASIAIYALAFGDGLSSIVGKIVGGVRIPLTGGKTLAGSATCFTAVFIVAFKYTGKVEIAAPIGVAATLLEALPTGDLDNIILPIGTGFLASQLIAV